MGKPVNHRTVRILCMLVLGIFMLAELAWAAVLEDGNGSAGRYTNLTAETGGSRIGWSRPPDSSYLSQATNRSAAQAVYEIWDTESVTVTLYSRYASFATESDGEWYRGDAGGGGETRLGYSTRNGEVYLDELRMIYDANAGLFLFEPESNVPSGLVDYGLNVYWSVDGNSYEKADCWLVEAAAEEGAHYFETYGASVDWEACYLKLVLYDQSSIEVEGRGERYEFAQKGGLAIASVVIDGQVRKPVVSSENMNSYADDLLSDAVLEENIIETAPQGTPIFPAFSEELPNEGEEPEESVKSASSKAAASPKSAGSKVGPGQVIQGGGVLSEPDNIQTVIRPASLQDTEITFLDRLSTPEGLAILFFSLACILLAMKMLVKPNYNEK